MCEGIGETPMHFILDLQVDSCVGCGACSQICPKNAVNMVPDQDGFLYPRFIHDECVECGRCVSCCPAGALEMKAEAAKN